MDFLRDGHGSGHKLLVPSIRGRNNISISPWGCKDDPMRFKFTPNIRFRAGSQLLSQRLQMLHWEVEKCFLLILLQMRRFTQRGQLSTQHSENQTATRYSRFWLEVTKCCQQSLSALVCFLGGLQCTTTLDTTSPKVAGTPPPRLPFLLCSDVAKSRSFKTGHATSMGRYENEPIKAGRTAA